MRKAKLPRNTSPTRAALIADYRAKAIEAGCLWHRAVMAEAGVESLFDLTDMQMLAALID